MRKGFPTAFGTTVPALLLAVLPAVAPAAAEVLRLDPEATEVDISLGSTFHQVHGTFSVLEGEICFDPTSGAARGTVVIDSASGSTDNNKRDKKMHGQVLESGRFPRIIFRPSRIRGTFNPEGDSALELLGSIEIHGTSQDIGIRADVHVAGPRMTGTGRLSIPYVAWGLKDPSVFLFRVQKEVDVSLDLQGSISADPIAAGCPGPD